MRRLRQIALGLIAVFALEAGTAAVAAAATAACCPAMAEASQGAPAPPCRTLAAVGCCEERSSVPAPGTGVAPAHGLLGLAAPALVRSAPERRAPSAAPGPSAARALRTTILRL